MSFIPSGSSMYGNVGSKANSVQNNQVVKSIAEPDNPSLLIQNLISLPAFVERMDSSKKQEEVEQTFAHEDPTTLSYEALEPTSGRKVWKLRHHKKITKTLKRAKNGF